jgi:hypothetical protein
VIPENGLNFLTRLRKMMLEERLNATSSALIQTRRDREDLPRLHQIADKPNPMRTTAEGSGTATPDRSSAGLAKAE